MVGKAIINPWIKEPSGLYLRHEFDLHIGGGVSSPYYPVGADCVGYWDFGDGLQSAADHSSYGNDGTVVGAIFVADGLDCDGIDDKVSVLHNANMNHSGNYSIYAWLKSTNFAQQDQYAVGKYTSIPLQYSLALTSSKTVYQWSGTSQLFSTWTLDDNSWQLVCTSQISPGNTIFYKNATTSNSAGPSGVPSTNNTANFFIADLDGSSGLNAMVIVGQVLIFNTNKSADDVLDYYNFTKARYGL